MRDTTLIDYESASKLLTVLYDTGDEFIEPAVIKASLAAVVAMKLDLAIPALGPEDDRFKKFFDMLFEVAPEDKALPVEAVIELVEMTIEHFDNRIAQETDPEEQAGPIEDGHDYIMILGLLRAGDYAAAVDYHQMLDTYARGQLFGRNEAEEHQLRIFINEWLND